MLEVVIATGNRHKYRELSRLLRVPGIRWHSLEACARPKPTRESGRTFDANAIAKARAVAQATGHLALADDSGIEVDALGGGPGVRSARFAGAHGDDAANNRKMLRLLSHVPEAGRGARYRCSLALAAPSGWSSVTRGSWEGRIAWQPAGRGGFGYDPIFRLPRLNRTVGQLPASAKRRLSHRAQAARRMRRVLARLAGGASGPRPARPGRNRPRSGRAVAGYPGC